MKKIAILLAAVLTASAGYAQQTEETTPNRILVTNTAGNYTGYVIDYLSDISFARVDGEVLANIEIDEVNLTEMTLSITRTPECFSYKLAVLPQVTANRLTDDVSAIKYINSLPSGQVPVLYEDYDKGTLSGIELNPESDYTIFTIGIDRYGVEAGVARASFSTPAPEIEGNPHVDIKVTETTRYSFTVLFQPNEDVQNYWILSGEKGTMQAQYEMFAPMFGFSNFSDMIKMWGVACEDEYEFTWSQMAPNTEYEVFVAMTDVRGSFAPYEVYEVATDALGGSGDAYVDIEVGNYELTEWEDGMGPALTVSYTPNNQSSCYRMAIYSASYYNENSEECNQELCSDPWMPTSNWFQYEAVTYDYRIEPANEIVIIAAAKNGDGVWGEVNVVNYTTPDSLDGYEPASVQKAIKARGNVKNAVSLSKGVIPQIKTVANKMQLRQK